MAMRLGKSINQFAANMILRLALLGWLKGEKIVRIAEVKPLSRVIRLSLQPAQLYRSTCWPGAHLSWGLVREPGLGPWLCFTSVDREELRRPITSGLRNERG